MTGAPAPPSPFTFRRAGLASARFSDVAAGQPIAVDALAARVLALPPRSAEETPFEDVLATMNPPVAASTERAPSPRDPREAAGALRRALESTIDRLLEGVGRVAVLTGGGVDSSSLLALAVRRARRVGGSAFGVALDFDAPGDDRPFRASLAAYLDCEIIRVRPEDAAPRAELVARGVDGIPLTWPGGPMEVELLARAKANGAECALMGVGADELLDGDPRSLADIAHDGSLLRARAAAHALTGFGSPRRPFVSWVLRPLLARALPVRFRTMRARGVPLRVPTWARPRLRRTAAEAWSRHLEQALRPPRDGEGRFGAFRDSLHHVHLLWLRHQEQIASGLERRDPFLDPELARFVTSLRPAWLLHGGTRRGLFREAMRDVLPEDIRVRESKASFEPAFGAYVGATGGFAALERLSDVRELAALDLVEPRAFRAAFAAFVAAPTRGWEEVWPALAVESFLRHRGRS